MLPKTRRRFVFVVGLISSSLLVTTTSLTLASCCAYSSSSSKSIDKDRMYTTQINWDDKKSIARLTVDDQGLVYANKTKTELVTILPSTRTSNISIPSSVKAITGYVNTTPKEMNKNGPFYVGAFETNTNLTTITFDEDSEITLIGNKAFSGCSGLSSLVSLQKTKLVTLGHSVFSGTSSLENINLPDTLQVIGDAAFSSSSLKTIDLSSTQITTISSEAFKGSSKLESAKLSTSLEAIKHEAFKNCSNLSSLSFGPEKRTKNDTADFSQITDLVDIETSAFTNTKFASVDMTNAGKVTTICSGLFFGSEQLKVVKLPYTLLNWRLGNSSDYTTAPFGVVCKYEEKPDVESEEVKEPKSQEENGGNEQQLQQQQNKQGQKAILFSEEKVEEKAEKNKEQEKEKEEKKKEEVEQKNGEQQEKPQELQQENGKEEQQDNSQDEELDEEYRKWESEDHKYPFSKIEFTLTESTTEIKKFHDATWANIADIMNMFAKFTSNNNSEDNNKSKIQQVPQNISLWSTSDSWIDDDLNYDTVKNNWKERGTDDTKITDANGEPISKKHNGVEWKLIPFENGDNDEPGFNEVAIVGFGVNLYKAKADLDLKNYQVPFYLARKDDQTLVFDESKTTIVVLKIITNTNGK